MQKGIDLRQRPRRVLDQEWIQWEEGGIGNERQDAHPQVNGIARIRGQFVITLDLPEDCHHVKGSRELGNSSNKDITGRSLVAEPSHGTYRGSGNGSGSPKQFGKSRNGSVGMGLKESGEFTGNASHGLGREGDTANTDGP